MAGEWRAQGSDDGPAEDPGVPWPPGAGQRAPGPIPEGTIPTEGPEVPRRDRGRLVWDVLLVLDLAALVLMFGAGILQGLALLFFPESGLAESTRSGAEAGTAGDLWLNQTVVFVLLAYPFLWLLGTRRGRLQGALQWLRLRASGRDVMEGVAWGGALLLLVLVLGQLGAPEDPSPVTEGLLRVVDWPLAVFISLTAAVGEEVFFRGFLQRRIGWIWQAVLFGITHASYGTPLQVLVPFLIGLLFGALMRKGRGLLAPITAHFVFNFVQFALFLAARGT